MQLVLNRKIQKFFIRDAAPKEKRKARGELQIADSISDARRNVSRLTLEAEDKPWIDEHACQSLLDAAIKIGVAPPGSIKAQQRLEIGVGDRTPVSPPRERRQDPLRARELVFICRCTRPADENATPARRVAGAGGSEGSSDGHALHPGIVGENLPDIIGARRVLTDERDPQLLWPSLDREAQIERPGRLCQLDALAVERHFQLVVEEAGRTQSDVRGLSVNLDRILSVQRKDIPHQNSAARA